MADKQDPARPKARLHNNLSHMQNLNMPTYSISQHLPLCKESVFHKVLAQKATEFLSNKKKTTVYMFNNESEFQIENV